MTTDSENSLQESYRLYLSIHRLEIEIIYLLTGHWIVKEESFVCDILNFNAEF